MNFIQKKKKGYILIETVLAMIVVGMLSISLFTIFSGQFSMIQAGRTALAAQQYAEIDADTVKLLSYDELDEKGVHTRQAITSVSDATDWEDEITISAEKSINDDTESKQRIATIKVYKTGDTLARYSLQVPLSSKGSSVPSGTVLAWYGDITKIPDGFYLCNGTNGTPDLQGRTIIGTGSFVDSYGAIAYSIGNTGGERLHRLTINEMPSHSHKISFYKAEEDDGSGAITTGYRSGINPWGEDCIWTNPIGGDQPHNVMCPYYALAYIMKK